MELSYLVVQVLAVTYLAAAIAALSGKLTFEKVISDFQQSQGLTFISGFVTLVIGIALVTYHNNWVKDWTVIVTIVGWISVVKGFVLIAFPHMMGSFKGMYQNTKVWGVVLLVLAGVFGYLGFMV